MSSGVPARRVEAAAQTVKKPSVLGPCPDRDPEGTREPKGGHGADDHALAEKPSVQPPCIPTRVGQEEVRDRRCEGDSEFFKAPAQFGKLLRVALAGSHHVRLVVEGGMRRNLGHGGGIERRPHALERSRDLGQGEGITDPQARETVDLRERPQDHEGPPLCEVGQAGRIIRCHDVFLVGFVKDDDEVFGNLHEKGSELSLGDVGSRRVVGVRDLHEPRLSVDPGTHRVEIVPQIPRHRREMAGAPDGGDCDPVHDKGSL